MLHKNRLIILIICLHACSKVTTLSLLATLHLKVTFGHAKNMKQHDWYDSRSESNL